MAYPNVFLADVTDQLLVRIDNLTQNSKPQWGKMDVAQMLAHCNVSYEMVYTDKHPKPNLMMGVIYKLFVKKVVTGETAFPRNSRTAPQFIINGARNFDDERNRLKDHIRQTQQLGPAHFHKKKSHSFGVLSKDEWNNMFYKHLDHHLTQFQG